MNRSPLIPSFSPNGGEGVRKTDEGVIQGFQARIFQGIPAPVSTASARINEFVVGGVRRARGRLNVFPRTGAGIDVARVTESLESGQVQMRAFGLIVGTKRAAAIGAFLPLEAEPFEVFVHGGHEFQTATGGIEVFVAQNENAVLGAGVFLGSPKRSRVPEVKIAGGRGSNPAAI